MRATPWDDVLGARRVFGGVEMALWDARGRAEGSPAARSCSAAPCAREVALTEYFAYRLAGAVAPGRVHAARGRAPLRPHDRGARRRRRSRARSATVSLDEEVEMVREVRAAIGDRAG